MSRLPLISAHGLDDVLAWRPSGPVTVRDFLADAQAVAYLELRIGASQTVYGVGRDTDIVAASLKAVLSGLQRATITVSPASADVPTANELAGA